MKDILTGSLVRLSAVAPEEFSKALARWERDSEFMRLLEGRAFHLNSAKKIKEWLDKEMEGTKAELHWFTMRSLHEDKLLGDIILNVINWGSRDSFVGIGIGERDFLGKGYGSEAMQLILQFAFVELNLHRVTLGVFEYNPRAIRSYEKIGFQHEGRMRGALLRDGKRWDMFYMGILHEDWMVKNGY